MPNETTRVAVIGPEDVVLGMGAMGVDVFAVSEAEAPAKVEELVQAGYQVIFYTDNLTGVLRDVVERFSRQALPCVVALPFSEARDDSDPLVRAVARAVGADLLNPGKGGKGEGLAQSEGGKG